MTMFSTLDTKALFSVEFPPKNTNSVRAYVRACVCTTCVYQLSYADRSSRPYFY